MEREKYIKECQKLIKEKSIKAYLIPTADYHQSEYIVDFFKGRNFLTGFSGSAGICIVFQDEICLWTDGRYHIQAENEIRGTSVKLFKQGNLEVPTFIEYLISKLEVNDKIAFDAKITSTDLVLEILSKKEFRVESFDIFSEVWKKRPKLPRGKLFLLEDKYSGKKYVDKLEEVRTMMKTFRVDYNIITSLDDIAWLFNFRGTDIVNNPTVLSYAIISADKEVILYINKNKLNKNTKKYFNENKIILKDYFDIFEDTKKLKGNILIEYKKVSYEIYSLINSKNKILNLMNPTTYLKAHKNEIEIENTKQAHIIDGIAIFKFMYWLKTSYKKEVITEIIAENKIDSLRRENHELIDLSFRTISAFGKNAAMMHYSASEERVVKIKDGVFLLDSGGHYLTGTTDITRTFFLGKVPRLIKEHNTLVLKGMLALTRAKFLYGATGTNLDILARQFLWNNGIDYKCGTGHGVGHILNVHEGPHGIRVQYNSQRLEAGMIMSNEPGCYIENSHGIRIENEILVREYMENEHGKFMEFETLTFAPIDLDGIVKSLLTGEEKKQLNDYHRAVYEKLSKYLSKKEIKILKEYTKEI